MIGAKSVYGVENQTNELDSSSSIRYDSGRISALDGLVTIRWNI